MRLTEIHIENFRSCRDLKLKIGSFGALIGYNNTGKSNCLRAIEFFFKKNDRVATADFWDERRPVSITAKFEMKERPNAALLTNYSDADRCVQVRLTRQIKDDSNRYEVFSPGLKRFVALTEVQTQSLFSSLPEMVPFMTNRGSSEAEASAQAEKFFREVERVYLRSVRGSQEALFESKKMFYKRLNAVLDIFYPGLMVKEPSEREISQKDPPIWLTENGRRPYRIGSSNAMINRLVSMALLVLIANSTEDVNPDRQFILLIDEPEVHMHPALIEILGGALVRLGKLPCVQVLLTTHSPMIVQDATAFVNTKIIRKSRSKGTYVANRNQNPSRVTTALQKFINLSNSSYALFASRVILVEGEIDKLLLYALIRKARPELVSKIGFIVSDGCNLIEAIYKICENLGLSPRAICDLDHIKSYESGPYTNATLRAEVLHIKTLISDESAVPEWPSRNNNERSRIAFIRFAKEHPREVDGIHDQLLKRGLWIWAQGDLEEVFGFKAHLTLEQSRNFVSQLIGSKRSWQEVVRSMHGNVAVLEEWLRWVTGSIE